MTWSSNIDSDPEDRLLRETYGCLPISDAADDKLVIVSVPHLTLETQSYSDPEPYALSLLPIATFIGKVIKLVPKKSYAPKLVNYKKFKHISQTDKPGLTYSEQPDLC